ncbi:hypothetical protein [Pseudomonas chlororaphis]|uniref:hypothetical protein n=1 Tax=Pseudomonas chlororaphis TaxID=587753 RepID=UPI0005638D19|nr:hypothetical protein [Pseudomonas chlororaphis]
MRKRLIAISRLSLAGIDIALHPLEVVFNVESRSLFVAGDNRFVNQAMLRHVELDAISLRYFPGRLAGFASLGHRGLLPLMAAILPIQLFKKVSYRT